MYIPWAVGAGIGLATTGVQYYFRDRSRDAKPVLPSMRTPAMRRREAFDEYRQRARHMEYMDRRYRNSSSVGNMNNVAVSASGTVGLTRTVVKRGRRDPDFERKLVRASERYAVFCMRALSSWNSESGANRGYFGLGLSNIGDGTTVDVKQYPVHIFNLTAVPQGPSLVNYQCVGDQKVSPVVGFTLQQARGTNPNSNRFIWNESVLKVQTIGTGAPSVQVNGTAWSPEQISDLASDQSSTATIGAFGRHHYLSWVDVRLMVYGKRKHDTEFTISLVKFREAEYCPEYFKTPNNPSSGGYISDDDAGREVNEWWRGVVTGLVNNPIMSRPRIVHKKVMDVLYSKKICLGTKQTDEANADVMTHMFKMFRRMNKLYNHSNVDRTTNVETAAQILAESDIPTSRIDYGPQPSRLTDNVYLMVTAKTPHDYGNGDVNVATYQDYQNTYDVIIRKKCVLDLA